MSEERTSAILICELMDAYDKIQRIKVAEDKDAEIQHQMRLIEAKLQALGIEIETLQSR